MRKRKRARITGINISRLRRLANRAEAARHAEYRQRWLEAVLAAIENDCGIGDINDEGELGDPEAADTPTPKSAL